MAYQINSNVIISDSRALIGVSTAGINTALYVGGVEIKDNQIQGAGGVGVVTFIGDGSSLSGIITSVGDLSAEDVIVNSLTATTTIAAGSTFAAGGTAYFGGNIQFGSSGQPISEFSTDSDLGGGGASDNAVPTQKAVRTYVGDFVAGGVTLGVDGDSGTASLNLSNQSLEIVGTANEIETEMVSGISTQLVIGLPDDVTVSNNLSVSNALGVAGDTTLSNTTVSAGSTLTAANLAMGGNTVNSIGISSTLDGAGASDETLPSQKAVKDYVDSQVGSNANLDFSGNSGTGLISLSSDVLNVTGAADEIFVTASGTNLVVGVASDLVVDDSLTVGDGVQNFKVDSTESVTSVASKFTLSTGYGISVTADASILGTLDVGTTVNTPTISIGSSLVNLVGVDTGLAGNSDTTLPTEKAVKTYVDSQLGASNQLNFRGNAGVGSVGEIALATEILQITGKSNELLAEVISEGGNEVIVGLSTQLVTPGTADFIGVTTFRSDVTSEGTITGNVIILTGAGDALDVTNDIKVDGTINTDSIKAATASDVLEISGNLGTVELTGGNWFQSDASYTNTFAGKVLAEGPGIGLTVSNNAYISGNLTIDGSLNTSSEIGVSTLKTRRLENSSSSQPLVIDGEGFGVTFDSTGGPVTFDGSLVDINGQLTVDADANFSGILTASGQVRATAAGVGLTVTNDAFIGGDLTVGGLTELSSTEGLRFGPVGTAVSAVVVSITPAVTNNQLPSALAVKNYVDNLQAGSAVSFTSDNGVTGQVDLLSEILNISGTANQIETETNVALGQTVTFKLPNEVIAPGSVKATTGLEGESLVANISAGIGLSVVADATIGGTLDVVGEASFDASPEFKAGLRVTSGVSSFIGAVEFGSTIQFGPTGQTVNEIGISTTLGSSDSILPTQKAVKEYVDGQTSSASNVTVVDAADEDATFYVPFTSSATGAVQLKTDASQLEYNPSSGILQAQEFNALSDIRFKENIEVIADPLTKIDSLRGVTFDWKDAPGRSAGIIAQEVKAVMPDLITETEEKMTVNYNGLVGLLIEAVKELTDRVEELESRN